MRGLEDLGSLGKGSRNVWRGSKGIAQQQAIAALPRNLDGQGRLGRFGVTGKTNASYPYALPACFIPCSPQPHATHHRQGASSPPRPRGHWLMRHGNALRARRHRYSNRLGDRSRAGPEQGRGNALTVSKSSSAISSWSSVEETGPRSY